MVSKKKATKSNIDSSRIKKSIDLATASSTSTQHNRLLEKLSAEMDALIKNNIESHVENDTLRLRSPRQCANETSNEDEEEVFDVKRYQQDEIETLRALVEVLKEKIHMCRHEQKVSTEQLKKSFTVAQVNAIVCPLQHEIREKEREVIEKDREVIHWKNRFMRKKGQVKELQSALLQYDQDMMDIVNETNALVHKKNNEDSFFLGSRLNKVESNSSNLVLSGDNKPAILRPESLPSLSQDLLLNKPTGDSNVKLSKIKNRNNSARIDKSGQIIFRHTVMDEASVPFNSRRKFDRDLSIKKESLDLDNGTDGRCLTRPPKRNLTGKVSESSLLSESSLQDIIKNGLIKPNLINSSWDKLKFTEGKNGKLVIHHHTRPLSRISGKANSQRAAAA
eukprot:CAMPEP_0194406236 /NCGR_PEP_ID=MMETSP0176-20130528/4507_1 /TAXON_ID=216777 /ORGANISM="Proboscia alata, Strain PI-D3" /LENGTH=392 /DNA_ID=CAMNT_0039205389 /DNA_START=82 /DNA_END=1260 /DNA_ORIENTATION=+